MCNQNKVISVKKNETVFWVTDSFNGHSVTASSQKFAWVKIGLLLRKIKTSDTPISGLDLRYTLSIYKEFKASLFRERRSESSETSLAAALR